MRYWESREHRGLGIRVRHQADTSTRECKNDYTTWSSLPLDLLPFPISFPTSSFFLPTSFYSQAQNTKRLAPSHRFPHLCAMPHWENTSELAPSAPCCHHRRSREGKRLEYMNAPSYYLFWHKLITNRLNLYSRFFFIDCSARTTKTEADEDYPPLLTHVGALNIW